MIKQRNLCLLALILISPNVLQAQNPGKGISGIISSIDSYEKKLPGEKLYLHFDKPRYAIGDTMWFKAYLLDSRTLSYSGQSGLMYVELLSDSGRVASRISLPVAFGLSWGQIPLDREKIPGGGYTIRAYTNWMQNFGEEGFFKQHFYIADDAAPWMINESHELTEASGKQNLKLTLQLSSADKQIAGLRNFRLKLMDGKQQLYSQNVQATANGVLQTEIPFSNEIKGENLAVIAQDIAAPSKRAVIPLLIKRPENIDLQFMPEGGQLVADLPSRIGFKALGEDGLGTDVEGKIINSKKEEVGAFRAVHNGMGVFSLVPNPSESYSAIISSSGAPIKTYRLPAVKPSGIVMKLDGEQLKDSILFTLFVSADLQGSPQKYHLLGISRGIVCYAANFSPVTQAIKGRIAKSLFPGGVAHFTLFNDADQALAERLVYIDQNDNLSIRVSTDKALYNTRDSIALNLDVTDKNSRPLQGSFSLSVTDDSQVRTDNSQNILSNMLLSSHLKGNIESPLYYFEESKESSKARDILLMCQGWVGYNWHDIFTPPAARFASERELSVSGKVVNLTNKPISNSPVLILSPGRQSFFKDTLTNAEGRFYFSKLPQRDTLSFILQARKPKGGNFGMGLNIEEFKPAEIKTADYAAPLPWYVNSDSIIKNYVINNQKRQEPMYNTSGIVLKEVTVRGKKIIRDSQNLNGPGESDQAFNERDIQDAGRLSLIQLLEQKAKGFHTGMFPPGRGAKVNAYMVNDKKAVFIIDGVNLNFIYSGDDDTDRSYEHFNFIKDNLALFTLDDIKGIEIMYNNAHTNNYFTTFSSLSTQLAAGGARMGFSQNAVGSDVPVPKEYAFIEITTRSGKGPFITRTNGVAIYKPIPVSYPKQFYNPRYHVNNSSAKGTDLRSTLYWQPGIITNKQGTAKMSFYSADKPGTYTIVIQGTDLNGHFGYSMEKIRIGN